MKRSDVVFTKWSRDKFGSRKGNQTVARAVRPESEEITHDILWGLVPSYTGKVLRRRENQLYAVAA